VQRGFVFKGQIPRPCHQDQLLGPVVAYEKEYNLFVNRDETTGTLEQMP